VKLSFRGSLLAAGCVCGWREEGGRGKTGEKEKNTNQCEEFHYAGMLEGGCLTGTPNKKDWE